MTDDQLITDEMLNKACYAFAAARIGDWELYSDERVARLRQEWAKATPAPWEAGEVFIWGDASKVVAHKWTENLKYEVDGDLIVRLRNAAEAQLDLLQLVFERHQRTEFHNGGGVWPVCKTCRFSWPQKPEGCAEYRAALAVLDKLDPPGGDQ